MPSRSSVVRIARSIAGRPDVDESQQADGESVRPTGVIFVHGIGMQPARETLLNWASPIVEILAEWSREHDELTNPAHQFGEDPVADAGVDCDDECDERAWVQIRIPRTDDTHPATTWLLTEAHWAGQVRAPSLGQATRYLRSHVGAIVEGIANGYGPREDRRAKRLKTLIDEEPEPRSERIKAEIAELLRSDSLRWKWIDWLDHVWQPPPVRWLIKVVGTIATLVALSIYSLVRAIPIKAISERAELAILDAQLVGAFGDLPVLLDDPTQAAIVRSRLATAIRWVRDRGCDNVVLVAHSGGAIVSFATLLDDDYDDLRVEKLLTLGQGLSLGWRLKGVTGPLLAGNQIRGDLGERRPGLRWVDFWATYDPAPGGELRPIPGAPLKAVERVVDGQPPSPIQVESRPVTNYMHLGLDHDGYWRNDEGFLVPLIRHIDDPNGNGSGSRFYPSALERAVRIERRRRRVGLLLGWRWASLAAGVAAVFFASFAPVTPASSLATAGDNVAGIWARLPGHELVSGPIDGIGSVIGIFLASIGLGDVNGFLTWAGPQLLGALVPIVAVFAIYSRGVGSWRAADAAERKKIRREAFGRAGQAWARSEAVLLVGGLLAVVFAAVGPPLELLLAWLVAVAAAALVMRRS
jgi:hypothetical protein